MADFSFKSKELCTLRFDAVSSSLFGGVHQGVGPFYQGICRVTASITGTPKLAVTVPVVGSLVVRIASSNVSATVLAADKAVLGSKRINSSPPHLARQSEVRIRPWNSFIKVFLDILLQNTSNMTDFKLTTEFFPSGDQPQAIDELLVCCDMVRFAKNAVLFFIDKII
jgi:hypothetical protein